MNLSKPESKSVPTILVAVSKQGLITWAVDQIQFPYDLFELEVCNLQLRVSLLQLSSFLHWPNRGNYVYKS